MKNLFVVCFVGSDGKLVPNVAFTDFESASDLCDSCNSRSDNKFVNFVVEVKPICKISKESL